MLRSATSPKENTVPAFKVTSETETLLGREYSIRQFCTTFPNGYCVSAVFGTGNYCDGGETTCETAVWDTTLPDEPFVRVSGLTSDHNQVAGSVSPGEFATGLALVAAAAPGSFPIAKVGE